MWILSQLQQFIVEIFNFPHNEKLFHGRLIMHAKPKSPIRLEKFDLVKHGKRWRVLWTLYMLNFIWIFFLRSAHVKIFLDLENINEGLEYGTKVSMFMLRWMFMGKCLRVLAPPLLSVLRIPVIQKHQLPHITYSEAFILVNHTLNHTRQSFQNIWLHIQLQCM